MTALRADASGVSGAWHRPELDALRFLAFFLVFLAHSLPSREGYVTAGLPEWAWRPLIGIREGGGYGVDLFFLLSSYLITEILRREYVSTGRIDVVAFWVRRILRIWPLYFGFLAFAYWVVPRWLPQEFSRFHAAAYATFWGNFAVILRPEGIDTVAGILWSVSIEEQFYLLWPLAMLFLMPRIRSVCLALIAISWISRGVLVQTGVDSLWSFWGNTLTRLDPIAFGALLSVGLAGRVPTLPNRHRIALMVGGLLLFVVCGTWLPKVGPTVLLALPLAALGAFLVLAGTLGAQVTLPAWSLYLGKISYGLYVFHVFSIAVARRLLAIESTALDWACEWLLALALTILLASVSYRWLEKPFLRLKQRFSRDANA